MKIVVLMSTYNGAKYIEKQIESILFQKGNFQLDLLVRDDGSSDNTRKILRNYEMDGKLKWYSGKNIGPAYSFIDLIFHSPGYDYYSFADQDDYWLPDKLETAIQMLEKKRNKAVYFCNAELVDSELNSLKRVVYKSIPRTDLETLSCAGGILGCTMVFNRALADVIRKKIPQKIIMHDFYVSELCLALEGEMVFDSQVHMKYRQHDKNVIGVPNGAINTLKNRILEIMKTYKVSIADQASEILLLYNDQIDTKKRDWLLRIAQYNHSLVNELALSLTRKTKYANFNVGLTIRISILLGNR